VKCVTRIGLLDTDHPGANLSGITDPEFVPLLGQHLLEPLRMSSGFHPYPSWSRKTCIKRPGFTIRVLQPTLDDLAGSVIHDCNLLKACVKITPDNEHRSAPFLRALVDQQLPNPLGCEEPTTSSNHSLRLIE
jgi:hypothetical protein